MADFKKLSREELEKLSDAELDKYIEQEKGAAQQTPSTLEDIKQAVPSGLKQGGIQLVGAPGSMVDLAAAGIGKAADWWNSGPNAVSDAMSSVRQAVQPITATGFQRWDVEHGGNAPYQPKTTGGQLAGTAAEWAPTVATMGLTGGLPAMAKGATALAGSEGLGQLADKFYPDASSIARMVGALYGFKDPTKMFRSGQAAAKPGRFQEGAEHLIGGALGGIISHLFGHEPIQGILLGERAGQLAGPVVKRIASGGAKSAGEMATDPMAAALLAGKGASEVNPRLRINMPVPYGQQPPEQP
jgi:hypothetical protein